MSDLDVVFAGLPGTGKTSYIGLFYFAVTRGESVLRWGNYADNREHANRLAERLIRCESVERTPLGQSAGLRLSVTSGDLDDALLALPDTSGEVWEHLLVDREWDEDLSSRVSRASALCVFVNAAEWHDDPTIDDARAAANALDPTAPYEGHSSPDMELSQVRLLDLIQLLVEAEPSRLSSRLCIIISAFDTVAVDSPDQWLESNAPLVWQFLGANERTLRWAVFGVSAQGGTYADPDRLEELRQSTNLLERGWVKDGEGVRVGAATPVEWALMDE